MKTFFKELFITLLLLAVVILILTVLFYDSIPVNKAVPSKVTYTLPTDLKAELDATVEDTQEIIRTYRVTGDDINDSKRDNSYNPGKIDPFSAAPVSAGASVSEGAPSTDGNNGNSGSSNPTYIVNGEGNSNGSTTSSNGATTSSTGRSSGGLQK